MLFERTKKEPTAGSEAIGENIAALRKEKGWTQEQLAETLSVSAQAVSKWEGGKSCPDISLLPAIAKLFGVTVDALFSLPKQAPLVEMRAPEGGRKPDPDKLFLRVRVLSKDGDRINVNLPLQLIRAALKLGTNTNIAGLDKYDIDFGEILALVDAGCLGNLVDIESNDGDTVKVYVEELQV